MKTIEQLYQLYLQHPIVSTDTRNLPHGCIFFALKGVQFDGNQYAQKAIEAGAAYAVVDDPALTGEHFLRVPNVLEALQQLALFHRRHFDIPIIAIGGSNGKTTTKELVSVVLSSHYPCHFTKGNFNNHIGVPLTLLSMPNGTEVAVIEMGTNQAGDLDELCNIAAPTHGLLTNIGKEHLEGFGDLEGVKKAEAELYHYLSRHKGCVFLNLSEKYLRTLARHNSRRVVYLQSGQTHPIPGAIEIQLSSETPFITAGFNSDAGEWVTVESRLMGKHNFHNIMTAIALGIYFKVPAAKIKNAIEAYTPSNNRSQFIQKGTTSILLDAYNANPSSMKPALQTLQQFDAQRKIAILGDMLELGADSDKEHQAILRFAARIKPDQIVLVGPAFGKTDFKKYHALHFAHVDQARAWFVEQNLEHTMVLIKGSRGIRLEKILETA